MFYIIYLVIIDVTVKALDFKTRGYESDSDRCQQIHNFFYLHLKVRK